MPNLLEINSLEKTFGTRRFLGGKAKMVRAVDDVSFSIRRGETLALVGESGCGKSTTGRCLLRLIEPNAGTILYDGSNILTLSPDRLRALRREIQIIFQDPFSSLNPRISVDSMLREVLQVHKIAQGSDATRLIDNMLQQVGLTGDASHRYPHEFSGGQRQRIAIARALILSPRFVVCDEPVSALDVSVRAQILNLLAQLKEELHLTLLFISHDMAVVRQIADSVAVMYGGQLVEWGPAREIFEQPRHPYTKVLLASVPSLRRTELPVDRRPVGMSKGTDGCKFVDRCSFAMEMCQHHQPSWTPATANVWTRCHLVASPELSN